MLSYNELIEKIRKRAEEADKGQYDAVKAGLGAVHPYEAVQQAYGVQAGMAMAYQDIEQMLIKAREDEE